MASLRGVLFRDADFAAFYYPDNGKDSVPPSLLATALLLQSHDKVSDAEAKARADFDIRWKVALGIEVEDRPFAKSTLQVFRAKLVLLPGRSLETHRGIRLPASAARRHVGLQDGIAAVIAQGLELPVQHHAVSQPLGHPPVNVFRVSVLLSLSKGSIPWKASAWAAWPPATSGISAPYFERCPVPRRYPVLSGPLPSSRRSLSLVPPSANSVEHLHEDFVNDAPAIGWVNSTPAISLIFSSAITEGPPSAGNHRSPAAAWAAPGVRCAVRVRLSARVYRTSWPQRWRWSCSLHIRAMTEWTAPFSTGRCQPGVRPSPVSPPFPRVGGESPWVLPAVPHPPEVVRLNLGTNRVCGTALTSIVIRTWWRCNSSRNRSIPWLEWPMVRTGSALPAMSCSRLPTRAPGPGPWRSRCSTVSAKSMRPAVKECRVSGRAGHWSVSPSWRVHPGPVVHGAGVAPASAATRLTGTALPISLGDLPLLPWNS